MGQEEENYFKVGEVLGSNNQLSTVYENRSESKSPYHPLDDMCLTQSSSSISKSKPRHISESSPLNRNAKQSSNPLLDPLSNNECNPDQDNLEFNPNDAIYVNFNQPGRSVVPSDATTIMADSAILNTESEFNFNFEDKIAQKID